MSCPLCGQRKPRRTCPAVGKDICRVCCATKRQVEIRCPADCVYLTTAREHPAAAVKRQLDRDVAVLLPLMGPLTERQRQLFFLLSGVVISQRSDAPYRLLDDDVADAAGAMASTFETAARGVIYEQTPGGGAALELYRRMRDFFKEIEASAGVPLEREGIPVLRGMERSAREARVALGHEAHAYLELIRRLMGGNAGTMPGAPSDGGPVILAP